MKEFVQGIILNILLRVFYIFPIKRNQVICLNFNGKGFGESPKYISKEIINSRKEIDIYWVVNDMNDLTIPSKIKKVKYKSLRFFKILYTSGVIINDTRFGLYFNKRKQQLYIQTWHGCLAFKKIENDALKKLPSNYIKLMKHDSKMIDVMISNSDFFNKLCEKAFLYNGRIIKIGCPKEDVLINENQSTIRNEICNLLKINYKSLLIVYAPTFRINYENNPYDIDFRLIKKTILGKYNMDCEILVKLHPLSIDKYKIDNNKDIINVNKYSDIQKLLLAADIIITDYSSIMFDGLIANKPVILYAKDIKNYNKERGCYFTFDELPFLFAQNNSELVDIIKNNDLNEMKDNYNEFTKKVGLIKNGNASKKVYDLINSYINGENNE